MSNEDRARIARENGAKSKGPKTPEGKARVARNAIKTGEHAEKLAHFVPPHAAVLCNEDRKLYANLVDQLIAIYKPLNQAAFSVIGDMAAARWQIDRLQRCITMNWNLALLAAAQKPTSLAPELRDIKSMADASAELLTGHGVVSKMNREIIRLQQAIARNERRIKFIHANFPDSAPATQQQTQFETDIDVANTDLTPEPSEEITENELPVYVSENTPAVIEAYQREFPGRRIVILPPDNVANGVEEDDTIKHVPRKVA